MKEKPLSCTRGNDQ